MDSYLVKVINDCTDSCPDDYTHCVLYPTPEKLAIRRNCYEHFWINYCDIVFNHGEGDFYLGEIPPLVCPVTVTCNFEFNRGNLGEIYETNFILVMVKSFQDTIRENLFLTPNQGETICCVLDSNDNFVDEKRNIEIVQIRFQFPYCRVERSVFHGVLLPVAIQKLRENNAFTYLSQQPVNDWDTIIRQTGASESIPMYKSKTQPGYPTLLLSHIYSYITDTMLNSGSEIEPDELDIADAFFRDNHSHVTSGLISVDMFNHNNDINYWLPMFFSVNYWQQITLPKEEIHALNIGNSSYRLSMSGVNRSSGIINRQMGEQDKFSITDKLLSLLSIDRVEKKNYWLDVGKSLYNVYCGSDIGRDRWISFTERSNAIDVTDCEIYYDTFGQNNNFDFQSIGWYAMEDSPHEYENWHKSWYMPAIHEALSLLHDDVAKAFYRVNWLTLAFAPAKNGGLWYFYRDHRWNKDLSGAKIRNMVTGGFLKKVEGYRLFVTKESVKCDDESRKEQCEIIIKKSTELIKKLKNASYKASIVKTAADKFEEAEEGFENKLDTNDCLTGVRNCVLETTDTKCIPREGKPQDYISAHSTVTYPTNYTWDSPMVKKVMKWYRQTYPDENVMRYKIKADASVLRSRNSDKLFPVWSGDFNNSKSMWKKLFDAVYGPLSVDIPLSVLIKGQSNSGPNPELAQAKVAKIAFLCEPDDDTSFQNGILKMLTGGDSFFARNCCQDGGKTEARFKLILLCNKPPLIPHCDQAIKERLRVIPFLSTWVKYGAPSSEEEQFKTRIFPQNKFFDQDIPYMAPAALWIWQQTYAVYISEGLADPPEIIAYTEKHWEENDIYVLFISENVESVYLDAEKTQANPAAFLSLNDIYSEFTKWFKETYPGVKIPDRSSVKKELTVRWGVKPSLNNCWGGIQFKMPTVVNL